MSEKAWDAHAEELRDPHQMASQWQGAGETDPALLRHRTRGPFWDLLAQLDVTLLVSREYEHLLISLAPGRRVGFLRLPHPSGIAVDAGANRVHVAATRNPNQLFELAPMADEGGSLVPLRSRFLPGRLYLHDLAMVGGQLHGNAVGQDAVVRLSYDDAGWERVWWPNVVDDFEVNHLQLNSIAAGRDLRRSFFSASAARPGSRRPGQRNWPVDGRGVVFSGATGEPVAGGLTRPHSARFDGAGGLWVDNSGYGEVGRVADGRFEPVATLPGWTRGLCFVGELMAVSTSRVIPRFRNYAPGLDVERSVCGVHLLDPSEGRVVASLTWPAGNQVFAVEALPASVTQGFPFRPGRGADAAVRDLFFNLEESQ